MSTQPSPTAGMNIAQRILHVGGRNNAAGYVEFGSTQAVEALVRQVLRDLPAQADVMVDMSPPATARDRWMYEQGRLAERDPRTHAAEQAQYGSISDRAERGLDAGWWKAEQAQGAQVDMAEVDALLSEYRAASLEWHPAPLQADTRKRYTAAHDAIRARLLAAAPRPPEPVPVSGLLHEFDQLLQQAERAERYLASTPLPVASDVYSALSHACDQARRFMAEALSSQAPAVEAEPQQAESKFQWPAAADVGRLHDMSPAGHLRIGFDSDNDVFVEVFNDEREAFASVEFCNPGGGGGGRSSRTRLALIALMVAMEADNAERPDLDWWARRGGKPEACGIKGTKP